LRAPVGLNGVIGYLERAKTVAFGDDSIGAGSHVLEAVFAMPVGGSCALFGE